MQNRKSWIWSSSLVLRVQIALVLCSLFPLLSSAQIKLQLVGGLDCDSDQLLVHLEIQNTSDTILAMGNATFRLQYDAEVLTFQDYASLSLDFRMTCGNSASVWNAHAVDGHSSPGDLAINLSTHPDSLSSSCQELIPNAWLRLGSIWFHMPNAEADPRLSFIEENEDGIRLSAINAASPNDGSSAYSLDLETENTLNLLACEKSQIQGLISIQGRTDPSITLSTLLFAPNDLSKAAYTFDTEVDREGSFYLQGITPGTYYIYVKYQNTLSRVDQVLLDPGDNYWEAPILLGGDTNGDNRISLVDFGLLLQSFNKGVNDSSFNAFADFDNSQQVNILDFTILLSNYNQAGEEVEESLTPRRVSPAPSHNIQKDAHLRLEPSESRYSFWVGDTLTLEMWVDPHSLGVDGVETHMTYNSEVLELLDIQMGEQLELGLLNETETQEGRFSLAAGTFDTPVSTSFVFAQMKFVAKQEGNPEFNLYNPKEKNSHVTFKGHSILHQVSLPEFRVQRRSVENLLTVSPNPSTGLFLVERPQEIPSGLLRIFDLTGRMIHSFNWCQSCGSIYKAQLPQHGTYLINFLSAENTYSALLQIQ